MTQKYIKLSLKNIKPYLTKGSRKKQRGGAEESPYLKVKPESKKLIDYYYIQGDFPTDLEDLIHINGNVKSECIGKIKNKIIFQDELASTLDTSIYGKLIKINTTENIGTIYILAKKKELTNKYLNCIYFLPTNFIEKLIARGNIECEEVTLNVIHEDPNGEEAGAQMGRRAQTYNVRSETSNMYLQYKKENITSYEDFIEKMINLENKDKQYHFCKYICICELCYNKDLGTDINVPELYSFGFDTLKAVLKAEKLHLQNTIKTSLLGPRMAAVTNIICNAIFNKNKFKLFDGFIGPQMGKNIDVDSDFLTLTSRIMVKNKYLNTLQIQRALYVIDINKFQVIIEYPTTSIPPIKIDFQVFFEENPGFKKHLTGYLSDEEITKISDEKTITFEEIKQQNDKLLMEVLQGITQTVYSYLIHDIREIEYKFLERPREDFKNIYTYIYKELLSNFVKKPSDKNPFIDEIEKIFNLDNTDDLYVLTILHTNLKYQLMEDSLGEEQKFDYLKYYKDYITPHVLVDRIQGLFTSLKSDLSESSDIIDKYKELALKCLYNTSYYIFFVLHDLAETSYQRKEPIKSIHIFLDEIKDSKSYYSLFGDFKGINTEDSDYLEFYFHTIV